MNYSIKYLLGEKNFYKANLHSRSSLSDGRLSPEQLKALYKENGYSVLAITDNEPRDYESLCDDSFTVLSGFDFGVRDKAIEGVPTKSCTFTAISLNETPKSVIPFDAEYGSERINDFISEYRKNGYFVTYDHPIRSLEVAANYLEYKNLDAIEIINYSSLVEGYDEYNSFAYDLFLRYENRMLAIATDGNRNERPLDSERSDSLGAFTVIEAESPSYSDITKALSDGRFYASEGPEIEALWIKGDSLNIRCSSAEKIIVSAGRRAVRCFYSNESEPLTSATFKIFPQDIFVRILIIDKEGKKAYTRAYFIDEIME